jgi:hypothetical protein
VVSANIFIPHLKDKRVEVPEAVLVVDLLVAAEHAVVVALVKVYR